MIMWKLPNVMVMFDDAARSNGCLRVIDGSHRAGCLPGCDDGRQLAGFYTHPDAFDEDAQVLIECPAGSVVFFDPHIVHGSGVNASGSPRRAIIITLQPCGFAPIEKRLDSKCRRVVYSRTFNTPITMPPAARVVLNDQTAKTVHAAGQCVERPTCSTCRSVSASPRIVYLSARSVYLSARSVYRLVRSVCWFDPATLEAPVHLRKTASLAQYDEQALFDSDYAFKQLIFGCVGQRHSNLCP